MLKPKNLFILKAQTVMLVVLLVLGLAGSVQPAKEPVSGASGGSITAPLPILVDTLEA